MGQSDNLNRFVQAQMRDYDIALREIRAGKKNSHWMWYIFPQLRGLGRSSTSEFYGLSGFAEARAYYENELLGARLIEICNALLLHTDKTAVEIFGDIDATKLRSCMTLFHMVDPDCEVFSRVLACFFNGREDRETLHKLENE